MKALINSPLKRCASPRIPASTARVRALKNFRGFTLIEVMVALVIVSVALPALIVSVQDQMNNTAYIRDKSVATWVAQNQLALLQVEYRLTEKFFKGKVSNEVALAGRTWYYEIVSEQTVVEGMYRQTVSVGPKQDEYIAEVVGYMNE